jgi:hypothetical protein
MSSFVSPNLRVAEGQLTVAQVNAGALIAPAFAKRAITVVDAWVRAIGGAATSNTSIDLTDSTTGTIAVSFARAQNAENTILRAGATGATATYVGTALGVGEALKLANVGTDCSVMTHLDYVVLYKVEAVDEVSS